MALPTSIRTYVNRKNVAKAAKLYPLGYDATTCPIANALREQFPRYRPSVDVVGQVKLTSRRGRVYTYELSKTGKNKVDSFDIYGNMKPGHVRMHQIKK